MKENFNSKILFALGLVFFLAHFANSTANTSPAKQFSDEKLAKLQDRITSLLKINRIGLDNFGVQIKKQESILYSNNADKIYIPASVTKLFTAYSVLKNLGPTFKVKTQLYYDGTNLYLRGAGDSGFVSESMWFLVNEFHRQNIKNITGDIVVDDSLFDGIRFDKSRQSQRVDRAFDSPVGAMSFNWNSINVFVKPNDKVGQSGHVVLDPENSYFKLQNDTMTVAKIKNELIIDVDQKSRTVKVSGDLLIGAFEKAHYKNVADPVQWSGENLKSFLNQRGIPVKGTVRAGRVPLKAKLVAIAESKSVASLVTDMNKFSNNYVAEMLTKLLASEKSVRSEKENSSLADGMKIISSDAVKILGNSKDLVLLNPSGFSRENRISAAGLNDLLYAVEKDFSIFPSFVESLPVAGLDGTMKRRMIGTKGESFVRAKTGYLDNVVTLSGFAGHQNGELFHFTFLYNGPQDEALVRSTVDQIINFILE